MISPRRLRMSSAFILATLGLILVISTGGSSYPHGKSGHDCYYLEDCYAVQGIEWLTTHWPSAAAWSALAAFILAVITFQQLRWNRQQAKATALAAEAARRAVEITKQDLELTHRAYLSIDRVDFRYLGTSACYVIRKSGSLPASRIHMRYFRNIFPGLILHPAPGVFDIPMAPLFLGQIISHNEPLTREQWITSPDEAVHQLRQSEAGQGIIQIGFMIGYFDGFRERHTWHTYAYIIANGAFELIANQQE